MAKQRTIKNKIKLSGIGLMLGEAVDLTIKPADNGHGITFSRIDLPNQTAVKVCVENRSDTLPRCTSISDDQTIVNGVEHILSALAGMGIDNAIIELNAPEPPAFDGSAIEYVRAIQKVGVIDQSTEKRYIEINESITIESGDRQIILFPSATFKVTFVYDIPQLPTQIATFEITPETYATEIAPSRTFCLASEIDQLKNLGIGKGASDENVTVIKNDGSTNSDLRFDLEFVRHKILDLIGDFYIAGALPKAHVIAIRSGHEMNGKLIKTLSEKGLIPNRDLCREPIEAKDIYKILPHRHPMCMVDRVIEFEPKKRAIGLKNLSFNEPFFEGHFPHEPVMPGVLQMEALAQLGAWLVLHSFGNGEKIGYFASIKDAKFRRPVLPGDQLRLEIEILRSRRNFARIAGKAYVGSEIASEGELSIMIGG